MANLDDTLFGMVGAEEGEGAVMKRLKKMGTLDKAAALTAPLPVVGDIIGGAADFRAVKDNPTPMNVSLAALGMLPFVPSGMRLIMKSEDVSERMRPAVENALMEGANTESSRDLLVEMNPREFLRLANEGRQQGKMKGVAEKLAGKGEPLHTVPELYIDESDETLLRVFGHEGRHRARTLQAMGEKKIPVKIKRRLGRGTEFDLQMPFLSERELLD